MVEIKLSPDAPWRVRGDVVSSLIRGITRARATIWVIRVLNLITKSP